MTLELPFRIREGFDALYGLEITDIADDCVCGHVLVRDELKQIAGLVHGGVYASIAESLASIGTALVVMTQGQQAMGLSNHTSFMRPITQGTIHAKAIRKHRGLSTWIWEVELTDDQDRLCALVRATIAVRDSDEPPPQLR
jgi:1,4-dihydroxy-2-naphthoyl-CoA hydrolase